MRCAFIFDASIFETEDFPTPGVPVIIITRLISYPHLSIPLKYLTIPNGNLNVFILYSGNL